MPGADATTIQHALDELIEELKKHPQMPNGSNTPPPHLKTRLNQLDPSPSCPNPSQKLWFLESFAQKTKDLLYNGGEDEMDARGRCVYMSMLCDDNKGMMDSMVPDEPDVKYGAAVLRSAQRLENLVAPRNA